MRQARIFDRVVGGHPEFSRTSLSPRELLLVLSYLENAPEFLIERGFDRDLIDGAIDVPQGFHTDGLWVWPTDVAHYLRKHGVAPEPDFVRHMQSVDFRVPEVSAAALADAEEAVNGARVGQTPSTDKNPRAVEDQLRELRVRLGELGVAETAFAIRSQRDGRWCLESVDGGWRVAFWQNGREHNSVVFTRVRDACTYLLGVFVADPSRRTAGAPPVRNTEATLRDWPIQPTGGDPALTLLKDKRIVVVPTGTYLIRFGDSSGNLVFASRTPFSAMSLRPDRESQGPLTFRVMRPLYVLTGITVPWHNQPGGGTAYFLSRSLAENVAAGSLEFVP